MVQLFETSQPYQEAVHAKYVKALEPIISGYNFAFELHEDRSIPLQKFVDLSEAARAASEAMKTVMELDRDYNIGGIWKQMKVDSICRYIQTIRNLFDSEREVVM